MDGDETSEDGANTRTTRNTTKRRQSIKNQGQKTSSPASGREDDGSVSSLRNTEPKSPERKTRGRKRKQPLKKEEAPGPNQKQGQAAPPPASDQEGDGHVSSSANTEPKLPARKIRGRKRGKSSAKEKVPGLKKRPKLDSDQDDDDPVSASGNTEAKLPDRKMRGRKRGKSLEKDEASAPTARITRRTTRSMVLKQRQEKANANGAAASSNNADDPTEDDSETMNSSSDIDVGDDSEFSVQSPVTTRRGTKPGPKTKAGRGPAEERTCPHCKTIMSSRLGLQYHLDNYVCRIDECEDPTIISKSKRKRGKNKTGIDPKKRCRGALKDRTCPLCKRVFTSILGAEYHIKHKVCAQPKKDEKTLPFHQLNPGDRFVTMFGIVEVVKDERSIPTAELPSNIKTLVRSWQSSKANRDAQTTKWFNFKSMHLRARRRRINKLFESNEVTNGTVFKAYYGRDPRTIETKKVAAPRDMKPDPLAPKGSYPDRIVECVLVPDKRTRFEGHTTQTEVGTQTDTSMPHKPTRLYLRRKVLTDRYLEHVPTYSCTDCGQRFSSASGLRYHLNGKVCVQKNTALGESRVVHIKTIDEGARRILEGQILPEHPDATAPVRNRDRTKDRARDKKRVKKKKELGIYPEVLIFLGFEFVREDMDFKDLNLPTPVDPKKDEDVELQDSLQVDPPEALLASLKKRLQSVRRESDDQKFGSMYAGVYKALQYKKPRKKRSLSPMGAGGARKRRQKKERPPPPPKPLPPIIDTQTLADEVDSGRYPSMKRYKNDDHPDTCVICKDGGDLFCCDFCSNAEHLACIRMKFTVKDPEPKDDFMCHKCIQTVLARRARAEKRRREKQERDMLKSQQKALETSLKTADIEQGKEYEYMARRGQEVAELVELLQDAQNRVQQCLATTTMNNARRRIMGCDRADK